VESACPALPKHERIQTLAGNVSIYTLLFELRIFPLHTHVFIAVFIVFNEVNLGEV